MNALSTVTILIIEDDLDILFSLKTLLELEGFKVFTAVNGLEAMKLLSNSLNPDIILLDMKMPIMNGWEFAAEYSKVFGDKLSPILVMTAAGDAEQRASDVHASDWISKPFELEYLLDKIQKMLKNTQFSKPSHDANISSRSRPT